MQHRNAPTVAASATANNELTAYNAETEGFQGKSGLSFWVGKEAKYPLLAPVAQDMLSAPASEAYVERVFSVCGDLTAGKQNRLCKNLEKRVLLKMNCKYYA